MVKPLLTDKRKKILAEKLFSKNTALSNNRLQGANSNLTMVGNRNGGSASAGVLLHDNVAALLANLYKTCTFKNCTNFATRKNA